MSLPSPAEIAAALIAREELPAEKGDIGPQGMDGKAGEFGPPGPQGAKGDPGRNGTNGSNGNVGPKGATGLGGPRGPKGDKGDKGDEGERGPIGPMGPTGAVGSGKALFPRPGGGGSGSGLPAGGSVGQVVTNTAPGTGTWQDSSGLPLQWTDGGNGDVTAETDDDTTPFTIIAPESGSDGPFALRIEPAGPAWTGAVYVSTGDVGGLMGNAYVIRVVDEVNAVQVFDLDSWGSMALKGASASIQMYGGAPTHPEVLRALGSGEFKVLSYDTAPQIVLLSVDGRTGVGEIGFFGEQAGQQTAASLADLWAGLKAYGLLDSGSVAPAAGGSGSFLSVAKWA